MKNIITSSILALTTTLTPVQADTNKLIDDERNKGRVLFGQIDLDEDAQKELIFAQPSTCEAEKRCTWAITEFQDGGWINVLEGVGQKFSVRQNEDYGPYIYTDPFRIKYNGEYGYPILSYLESLSPITPTPIEMAYIVRDLPYYKGIDHRKSIAYYGNVVGSAKNETVIVSFDPEFTTISLAPFFILQDNRIVHYGRSQDIPRIFRHVEDNKVASKIVSLTSGGRRWGKNVDLRLKQVVSNMIKTVMYFSLFSFCNICFLARKRWWLRTFNAARNEANYANMIMKFEADPNRQWASKSQNPRLRDAINIYANFVEAGYIVNDFYPKTATKHGKMPLGQQKPRHSGSIATRLLQTSRCSKSAPFIFSKTNTFVHR